jgi:geranylgeranyl diphosphate synthase type I
VESSSGVVPPSFSERAGPFLASVEEELSRFLAERRVQLAALAPDSASLVDELTRMLGAGGKRIRPLFCFWGFRAAGGGDDGAPIARASAAVELLHTAAVIHDDLMDRAKMRRGRSTTHRHLGGEGPRSDAFGQSAAVLAGDLAQALADELLAQSGFAPERLVASFVHFNEMRVQAVAGEFMDLVAARRGSGDEAGARRMGALKSGSYSVVGPLLIGASLAGAPPPILDCLVRYGWPLGEAFQLRDDVLGAFGDPFLTGKDADTDIREGKQTALVARAREIGSPQTRRTIAASLGRPGLTPQQVEEVREALRSSGALDHTLEVIDALAARARKELDRTAIPAEAVDALDALAELATQRSA